MSEDLRARAREAAARVAFERVNRRTWESAQQRERARSLRKVETHVDLVLGVVADYCDEQAEAKPKDEVTEYGWNSALREIAEACRVQEDNK